MTPDVALSLFGSMLGMFATPLVLRDPARCGDDYVHQRNDRLPQRSDVDALWYCEPVAVRRTQPGLLSGALCEPHAAVPYRRLQLCDRRSHERLHPDSA